MLILRTWRNFEYRPIIYLIHENSRITKTILHFFFFCHSALLVVCVIYYFVINSKIINSSGFIFDFEIIDIVKQIVLAVKILVSLLTHTYLSYPAKRQPLTLASVLFSFTSCKEKKKNTRSFKRYEQQNKREWMTKPGAGEI